MLNGNTYVVKLSIKKVKILLQCVSKCVLYSTKLALEIYLITGQK